MPTTTAVGCYLLHFWGDSATELLIRYDGDEDVCFWAPVFAGGCIEAEGEIIAVGKTSRTMKFTAQGDRIPQRYQ